MDYIWSEQKKAGHYRRDVTLSAPNCPCYRVKEVLKILVQRDGWAQSYLCFENRETTTRKQETHKTGDWRHQCKRNCLPGEVFTESHPHVMAAPPPRVLAHRSSASSTRFIDSYPKVDMRWGAPSGVNFPNATEISESGIYLSSFSILGGLLKKPQSLAHIEPRSF